MANVTIRNKKYDPENLPVTKGDKVTWTNADPMVHTVTADNGTFDSGDLAHNGTFSQTFNQTGAVPYYCKKHAGMKGTITVT